MMLEKAGCIEYFYTMVRNLYVLVMWVCIVACVGSHAAFCPDLRNDKVIDDFLSRISSRYGVALPQSFFFQPMNVCEVLAFLDKVDSLASAGAVSQAEALDSRQLRKRISPEYGLYKWENNQKDSRINVRLSLLDSTSGSFGSTSDGFIRGTASPSLLANLGKMSFYSNIDIWTDYRSDSAYPASAYQPYDGQPYNLYGQGDSSHARSQDILRAGMIYDAAPFRLEAGVDQIKTGPAVASPVTMSGYAPPEIFFRAVLSFGILDYTQAFGQLQSQKDKAKFFYLHRFSLPLLSNRVIVGLNEVIINGSTTDEPLADSLRKEYYGKTRGWELAYMIPFVPYVFTEHFLGDKDNKALSFDVNVAMPERFRWYGEFFIDDMTTPWGIFGNEVSNKWAATLGGQYFGRLCSRDLTAGIEYCRVEPWVYTHFYGGSHRYDNFNVPLGAPLGPNSDMLTVSCESRVFALHTFGISLVNERTNRKQRGGSIKDVFQDSGSSHPDSPTKSFLDPDGMATVTRAGVSWSFNRFGLFRATMRYDCDFSGKSIVQLYGGLYF
jgi:hypothetical protein